MRMRDLDRAIKAIEKAQKKIDKMNEKYPKLYQTELDELGKTIIAQWYASYDPIYYQRTRSLYHAFDVSLDGSLLVIDFDREYMDNYISRQYNEWIYENSFENGYHGGAIPKDGSRGNIPYWRTPYPELTRWGRPAIYSFSPFNRLYKEMTRKIKQITEQKQDEFNKVVAPVERAIRKIL